MTIMGIITLTKQGPTNSPEQPLEPGAGAPEITPEMLEAGATLVQAWDYDLPSLTAHTHRELARQVYEAMRRLSPD